MTQTRPVFHPITPPAEVSDEELAEFARSKGVSTMVKPTAQTPSGAPQTLQDVPTEPPSTPASRKTPAAKKPAVGLMRVPPNSKLSMMVPTYVIDAVNLRAAQDRCSSRYLVLQGLKAIGLPIEDADLVPDARRSGPQRR